MSERIPWWKAFLPKWKSGAPKDTGSTQTFGADFDPFAQRPEKPKDSAPVASSSKTTDDQPSSQQEPDKGSGLPSEDTYDDSQLESVFNEQTCRRNMKVSRSGRFKEKRRARSSFPIEEKDMTESAAAGKEERR